MRVTINEQEKTLTVQDETGEKNLPLYSDEAFAVLSRWWVKVGWGVRYGYGFSWMGRPIIQLPEDMVRIQEVLYQVQPDLVIETGVAHGGSLIFYASLFRAMGRGRVLGIDLEIRPHNRKAIEAHALSPLISLIEGDSAAPETLDKVRAHVKPGEKVLILLDSNHSAGHVYKELEAYYPLVTKDSYIVATDGIMYDLHDVPGGHPSWTEDNPCTAVRTFLEKHKEFVLEDPPARVFDESRTKVTTTHWPMAYLRRTQ